MAMFVCVCVCVCGCVWGRGGGGQYIILGGANENEILRVASFIKFNGILLESVIT